jgi:GNAT superfamily N-acetyltransferase
MTAEFVIRPAQPEEATRLTEVAMRSKASWGYHEPFIEAARDGPHVQGRGLRPLADLRARRWRCGRRPLPTERRAPDGFLTDLWLEPEFQGRGFGRLLWEHALASAAALGYRSLVLEADPNAEGSYAAMGATRIGDRESPLAQKIEASRMLPLMRIELDTS